MTFCQEKICVEAKIELTSFFRAQDTNLRNGNFLNIIDDLLADHDDEELLSELHQTSSAAACLVSEPKEGVVVTGIAQESGKN